MEMQLLVLGHDKEREFAQDILAFAAKKYHATVMNGWTVTIEHIDASRWIDLFAVAKYSGQDPCTWITVDAWSTAWDEPVAAGWLHAATPERRRQLAAKIELMEFDPRLAANAVKHDLLICLNDSYATYLAKLLAIPHYMLYLVVHELLHYCQDWTGKHLVQDDALPCQDKEVITTLNDFVQTKGGWASFKRLYNPE